MTRGQDSLIIDIEPTPQAAAATRIAIGKLELIVIAASAGTAPIPSATPS